MRDTSSLALSFVLALVTIVTVLRPEPAAALPSSPEGSWIDLAPLPDNEAKVDPAGRSIVYLDALDLLGPAELWSLAFASNQTVRLSGSMEPGDRIASYAISPDGRWVAFSVASGDGPPRLHRSSIEGGLPIRVDDDRLPLAEPGAFAFRADSGALAFRGGPDRIEVVVLIDDLLLDGFETGDSSRWSDTTANACATPTGGPTNHVGTIAVNENWTANASPHVLTNNTLIPAGVTVTVAPCAEVRVHSNSDLTVQGTLIARGTPLQRIKFRRDDPALAWDSIWVRSPGFADLAFLDLSGGGAAGTSVLAEGNDLLPPARPLLADHLKVTGSTSYGVRLFRRAGFHASSRDLVVSGAGGNDPNAPSPFPVRMSLNTVGTLPVGSYTGNGIDLIQVVGEGTSAFEIDDAFHDRGVPYQIGGTGGTFGLFVVDGDPTLATLTIDPGVEIRFYTTSVSNKGGLFVGTSGSMVATGRLVAVGTALAPILLTGAGGAPVAGSWEGVTFFGALASGNLLDHVQIDAAGYNGGDSGFGCPPTAFPESSGALKLFNQPSSQFLTNSTISRSSTHGVYRAWTGAQVDFLPGNSFVDVPFCNQVLPKPDLPAVCPTDPECP